MSQTIDLALDGLSCGHCVKRVKESLEQRPDVDHAEVTIEAAHVTGSASADALIETCLLYRSPSPRDPKTSRMPSSA